MELYRYYKWCCDEELEGFRFGQNTNNVRISFEKLPVMSETAKGYWFLYRGKKKWTGKDTKRRFAYTSKEDALNSFLYRQRRSISLNKWQIRYSELAIKQAEALLKSATELNQ